jgi:uncharacterized protein YdeI (YjbR/CyaY-like superfamily)
MTKSMMNPKVNSFISKAPKWQEEMEQLNDNTVLWTDRRVEMGQTMLYV